MPLAAVLMVLLSITALLLYVLPASKARLAGFAENRAVARAVAAANVAAESEGSDLQNKLEPVAETGTGEVLVVDRQGEVVARAGERLLSSPPEKILQTAADGERYNDTIEGGQRVAIAPLVRGGNIEGGVVFVPDEGEDTVNQIILRSGIEAAALASVLGGGLALLLATLVSRRVERLNSGAHAIERGDLSHRIESGFDDELGELAKTFNSMAEKLQDSFDRLKEGGATLNAILNSLSEGVLATDLEGNIMFINLAAREMLGLGSEDLKGPPDPWKDFDLPEAVSRCARQEECIEARVPKAETSMQVKLEHMPKFDDHRGGVLIVIQDLSEGRRLEATQHRFLANAAHELKTPITTIAGASEFLLTETADDPELRQRFLNHIFRESRRLQRLSDALLYLARTGVDLRNPQLQSVDLDGIAREAIERVRPLGEEANLDFRMEGQGARVWADREWLEQALLVVLSNAVQHSDWKGTVRVRLEEGTVAIEDEGVGISAEDLPHVFERFYRTKGGSGGFGLGLPICKDLVERMGGSIRLDSEEGVGTSVEIKLPEVSEGV